MRYEKPLLEKLVLESNSYSEVVRKLGLNANYYGNRQTVKKYIESFEISIKHFGNYGCGKNVFNKKLETSEILVENSTYRDTRNLKIRLYNEGLKERKCELCTQGEMWKDKRMSLILDHINGINNDNRLENLRIVCPNCNATLDTHCKGSKGLIKSVKIKIKKTNHLTKGNKCDCGISISNNSKTCKKCNEIKQRTCERPPYDELIDSITKWGYSKTGKNNGVSDNTIRKWVKNKY